MLAGLIAIVVVVVACTGLVVWLTIVTRRPLPALDRTPRAATVTEVRYGGETKLVEVGR